MEYIGTDLKYAFSSTGDFDFSEMNWDMEFFVGEKKVRMTKRNLEGGGYQLSCDAENMGCKRTSDGRWVFLIDTTFFGPGRLIAVLHAYIPDGDFDPSRDFTTLDKTRNEVRRFSLETIAKV